MRLRRWITYYCRFRGRGSNSRMFYVCVTIIALALIYTYPHKNAYDYHDRHEILDRDDVRREAEMFVENDVEGKDLIRKGEEEDSSEIYKDEELKGEEENKEEKYKEMEKDDNADNGHGDDIPDKKENKENGQNRWVQDDDDYNHEDPDKVPDKEIHDENLDLPEADDHIAVRLDVQLPDDDVKDGHEDDLQVPDAQDEIKVHHDDVDVPDVNDDNVEQYDKEKEELNEIHDDNLELPDLDDHVPVNDNVQLPDVQSNDGPVDNLQAPDVKDQVKVHHDDLEVPDVDDHHMEENDLENTEPKHDDNIEAPDAEVKEAHVDDMQAPDVRDLHVAGGDDVQLPNVEVKEGHPDDLPVPDTNDQIEVHHDNVEVPNADDHRLEQKEKEELKEVHDGNLDNPDADNHMAVKDDLQLPDAEVKDGPVDNLQAPEVKDEVKVHHDDVEVPDVNDHHVEQNDQGMNQVDKNELTPGQQKQTQDDAKNPNLDPAKQDHSFAKTIDGHPLEQCKTERTNFVYMKMVKSASETMVSMLRRFGYTRDLNFVQPLEKRIYIGWPYQIDDGYYRANKRPGKPFNILCEHAVYNKTILENLMPKDTVYFTSLREPYQQVKSMFSYYKLAEALKLTHLKDPFTEYMRNIDKYEKIFKAPETWNFRQCIPNNFSMTYNPMSFILGYPTGELGMTPDKTHDDRLIEQWLRDIDNSFSLVMIVDYFDESLVLLKRLMCWSWKEILHYNSNILRYDWKDNVDPENIRIYKQRSRVDYKLYNHFNQTFWRRVANEGNDFWGEVREYKKIANGMYDYCANTPNNLIYTIYENQWTKGFSVNKQDCHDMNYYYAMFLKIKDRYDKDPVQVNQPPMKKNVC